MRANGHTFEPKNLGKNIVQSAISNQQSAIKRYRGPTSAEFTGTGDDAIDQWLSDLPRKHPALHFLGTLTVRESQAIGRAEEVLLRPEIFRINE